MTDQKDIDPLISWNLNFDDYYEDYTYDDSYYDIPQAKVKVGHQEGYECIRCGEFYPYSEINQPDNTFKCWSCRNGLSTKR